MAVNLSPVGGVAAQFFDNSGYPLTGGKLYSYAAGTTTPATTYTSSNGATAHSNPIVLDAAGRVPAGGEIWLTDGVIYKFVLKTSTDTLIATYDNITGINSNSVSYTNQQEIITATAGQTVFPLSISYQPGANSLSVFVDGVNQYGPGAQYSYVETDSTTVTFNSGLHVGAEVKFTTTQQQGAGAVDAEQVSYQPPFTGSVATNVEAKLSEIVSVKDFGAVGDGVTDDTAAIQAAIATAPNIDENPNVYGNGFSIYFPPGVYKITSTLSIEGKRAIRFYGAGKQVSTIKDGSPSGGLLMFSFNNAGAPGYAYEMGFEELTIKSNRRAQPGSAGIFINTGSSFYVRNCSVEGFTYVDNVDSRLTGGFFDANDIAAGNYGICVNFVVSFLIDNCEVGWCGAGVVVRGFGSAFSSVGKITNSYINYSGTGVYTYGALAPTLSLIGTTVEANYSPGYGLYNNENNVNLYGCWFELNTCHVWTSRNSRLNASGTGFYVPRPSQPIFIFDNPISGNINQHCFIECEFNVADSSNNTTILNAVVMSPAVTGTGVLSYSACTLFEQGVGLKIADLSTINPSSGTPVVETWAATSAAGYLHNANNTAAGSSVSSGNTLYRASSTNSQGNGLRAFSAVEAGTEKAYIGIAGLISGQTLEVTDGVTAPSTVAGKAQIYVDTADGDLKIKFGDGTVKTIVTD